MMHNNLFTSNFNRIKIIFSIVTVISVLWICCEGLNFLYYKEDELTRIMWKNFYEESSERGIDNIIIGSSHVYCDINPYVLDEINGENNFNLSAPNLRLNAAYYMLKEANRKNNIQNVYIELFHVLCTGKTGDVNYSSSLLENWRVVSYMRPSWNKMTYIYDINEKGNQKYVETILPFLRYKKYVFDKEFIKNNMEIKISDNFRNYMYTKENENEKIVLKEKNFYDNTRSYREEEGMFNTQINLREEGVMPETTKTYLHKIIDYCDKEKINIVLFVSPIWPTQVLSSEAYDEYYNQIKEIATEREVPFYDFNYCKSEYLDIIHREYFSDSGHLNSKGAALFTEYFGHIVSESEEENKKYFYDSYMKKIVSDVSQVYGIYYSKSGDVKKCTIASNNSDDMLYRIEHILNDGKVKLIQDFEKNVSFEINANEKGSIRVQFCNARDIENIKEIYIDIK